MKLLLDIEDEKFIKEQEDTFIPLREALLSTIKMFNVISVRKVNVEECKKRKVFFLNDCKCVKDNLIETAVKELKSLVESYLNYTLSYFENKYSIELNEFDLNEKYLNENYLVNIENLRMNDIITCIENQLKGMTFEEKSIEDFKNQIRSFKHVNGKKTLELQGFNWNMSRGLDISATERLELLLKAVNYIEKANLELSFETKKIIKYGYNEAEFTLDEFSTITKYKGYQNGKMVLTFKNENCLKNFIDFYSLKE